MEIDPTRIVHLAAVHLAAVRDARALQSRRNSLIQALSKARNDLAVAQESARRKSLGERMAGRDDRELPVGNVKTCRQRVDELEAALTRASMESDTAIAASQSAGQVYERCVAYMREVGLALPLELGDLA